MSFLRIGPALRWLSVGTKILRSTSETGFFDQEQWESFYPQVLEQQEYKAGNPGQVSILTGEWLDAADEYCLYQGENFTIEDFIFFIQTNIADDKYEAVSEITEECAWELEQVYDVAYKGFSGAFILGRFWKSAAEQEKSFKRWYKGGKFQ